MAEVRLPYKRSEGVVRYCPDVCMRCGSPSSTVHAKEFTRYSKCVVVPIPFCEACEQRRAKRKRVGVIVILLLLALDVGSLALPLALKGEVYEAIRYGVLVLSGLIFVPLIFYVYGAFGFNLKPKRLTDTDIVLAGVSDEYAAAIEKLHDAENPFEDAPVPPPGGEKPWYEQ